MEPLINPDAIRELDGALCYQLDEPADSWFPASSDDAAIIEVVAVCKRCPVSVACLQQALDAEVTEDGYPLAASAREGIWGGTTPAQRWQLTAAKPRGSGRPGKGTTDAA